LIPVGVRAWRNLSAPWGLAITPPGLPRLAHCARAGASRCATFARHWRRRGSTAVSFASPAMAATPLSRSCPIRIISVHLLVAPGFREAVAAGQLLRVLVSSGLPTAGLVLCTACALHCQPGGRRLACHLEWSAPPSACHTKENPQPEPGAGVLMSEGRSSPGKASVHQPSTCTVTVLTVWALGAVTVSRPSRYTAWSRSRSMATGKRKLRLQVP
jgi:hypothetical protein